MLWRGSVPCDPTRAVRSKSWGVTLVSFQEDTERGPAFLVCACSARREWAHGLCVAHLQGGQFIAGSLRRSA
eukprot:4688798-Amphidinium_carterae.1